MQSVGVHPQIDVNSPIILNQGSLIGIWRRSLKQTVIGLNLIDGKLKAYRHSPTALRSRHRATHARLESYLPLYSKAIQFSLHVIMGGTSHQNRCSNVGPVVTCWADNLASAPINNRWMELASCANDFLRSIELWRTHTKKKRKKTGSAMLFFCITRLY